MEVKTYGNCYLYNRNIYEPKIREFLIKCERIDKSSDDFKSIKYEVSRRQILSAIDNVLNSDIVVLCRANMALPKTFKVFSTKDPEDGIPKVFIDCTGLIRNVNGRDIINGNDVDKLVALVLNAIIVRIYSSNKNNILNSSSNIAAECFSKMVAYVIDILRIASVEKPREKTLYLSALYFYNNIYKQNYSNDYINNKALKISTLNQKEAEILMFRMPTDINPFENINTFVECLASVLNCNMKVGNFVEKWLYLFGDTTLFGLEYFPAFSAILTDTYVGAYLNNQKSIEKILGINLVNAYAKEITKVCQECV